MFAKYSPLGLLVTMAPLYAGPFLAGWTDAPLMLVLALAAMFLLAQIGAGKDKGRGQMPLLAFLVMLAGAQLIAVAVVYGAGTLLRVIAGGVALPLWLPLGLTALGGVLFAWRYRYDPQEAELAEMLDDAIDQIERATPPDDDWADDDWDDDTGDDDAGDDPDMRDR